MDTNKLADDLLDRDPSQWPSPLGTLRESHERLPDTTRALLRKHIEVAKSARARRLGLRRAAAVLLVVVTAGMAGWFWWNAESPAGISVVSANGQGIRVGGKPAGRPVRLVGAQAITLEPGDSLLLALDGLSIEARGPAGFRILSGKGDAVADRISVVVTHPSAFLLHSTAGHAPLSFRMDNMRVRIIGTMLSLSVGADRSLAVQVLEGSARVEGPEGTRDVRAGQAYLRTEQGVSMRSLTPPERATLEAGRGRVLHLKSGGRVIDREVRLDSEGRIAAHYGTFHRVLLHDGREYRGFAVRRGGLVLVHTTTSIVELEAGSVRSIEVTTAGTAEAE